MVKVENISASSKIPSGQHYVLVQYGETYSNEKALWRYQCRSPTVKDGK